MNKFQKIKFYYTSGRWTAEMVQQAVEKNWLTQEECDEILTDSE